MSDYDYSWERNDVDYCDCCRIRRPVIDGMCRGCATDAAHEAARDVRRDDAIHKGVK